MSGSVSQQAAAMARLRLQMQMDAEGRPAAPRSLGAQALAGLRRGAEATVAGLAAPVVGVNQDIDAVLGRVPGLGSLRSGANRVAAADIGAMNEAPAVGLIANIASPANAVLGPAGRAATGLGRVGQAVLSGAAGAAAQPTRSGAANVGGIGLGAALGGALGGTGRLLEAAAARVEPAARDLIARGVRLATTDLLPGRSGATAKKVVAATPGRFADAAQHARAVDDYNSKVLYPWALEPIRASVAKGVSVGKNSLAAIRTTIGAAYDKAIGSRQVAFPILTMRFRSVPGKAAPARAILLAAALGGARELNGLSPDAQAAVVRAMHAELVQPFVDDLGKATVSGAAMKRAQSELRRTARSLSSSPDAYLRDAGHFLARAASNVTDLVAGANPEIAGALRANDAAWRRFMILEDAVPRRVAGRGEDEAVVTPEQILNGMQGPQGSPTESAWKEGRLPYQQMFLAHHQVLAGRADPSLLSLEMGGGLAAGALTGALGLSRGAVPAKILGAMTLGAMRAPFGARGSQLARDIVTSASPGHTLRQVAPYVGAAAGRLVQP
ncbi:MAG: hypothetical protein ACREFX_07425 [Opitutaceae bacterium]